MCIYIYIYIYRVRVNPAPGIVLVFVTYKHVVFIDVVAKKSISIPQVGIDAVVAFSCDEGFDLLQGSC